MEFRMVELNVINTVLRKFLTTTRMPGYLSKPEYAHLQERNSEIYMSSAFYQSHWAYDKTKAYFANMLDDKRKYFCCGLPYQLAIKEGLLQREQVEDEMSEDDFDEIAFSMEMGALWYGDSDGSFFRYDDISTHRKIKNAFPSLDMTEKRGLSIPELALGEKRIMSVDVALMATKKHANDATALEINVAIPNNNNSYISNIVYVETFEGLKTDELGLLIMRYFNKYKCTDLVLDCQGNGLGVYDFITKEQYDPYTGDTYEAMCSCNDENMASRCTVKSAKKVVWCVKATAEFNSTAATSLRAGIKNGSINFLASEFDIEESIKKTPGYSKMISLEQAKLKAPFVQTTLLINEMINLEHEIVNNKVKLKEKSGMRKDRFSSLLYNYYVVTQLSLKLKPHKSNTTNLVDLLPIKAPKRSSYF